VTLVGSIAYFTRSGWQPVRRTSNSTAKGTRRRFSAEPHFTIPEFRIPKILTGPKVGAEWPGPSGCGSFEAPF
jgi:hypothetical protein